VTERWGNINAVKRLNDPPCPAAQQIAADAFQSDPMWCYIVPDDAHRSRALRAILPLAYAQRYGEVWVTSPFIYGVAAWLSPGRTSITYWRFLRTAALRCALHLGPAAFSRFIDLEIHLEDQHGRDITQSHWYLLLLAVGPPYQGCGVGTQLLSPVMEKANAANMPIYVQTLNERNVEFYERHGFRVISKTAPRRGKPPCWGMILNRRTAFKNEGHEVYGHEPLR
jgi:ribosomal protein S18 acetylase RimI-like enzyme